MKHGTTRVPIAYMGRRAQERRPAGRRMAKRAGVSHLQRERLSPSHPVHVTLRMREGVWNLRSRRSFERLYACFQAAKGRFGFRLCEFSVLGNHIHLLVEADDARALARGI